MVRSDLVTLAGQAIGPALEWALREYDDEDWGTIYSEASCMAVSVAEQILGSIESDKKHEAPVFAMPVLVHLYNAGYQAGHHDTVEGGFVPVEYEDKSTYHEDEVAELLDDLVNYYEGESDGEAS